MADGSNALSFNWGGKANEVSRETKPLHQEAHEPSHSLMPQLGGWETSSKPSPVADQMKSEKAENSGDELSFLLAEIETMSSNTKPTINAVSNPPNDSFGGESKEFKPQSPQNHNLPLVLKIKDQKTLHAIWMPIFKYGGLFLPTDQLSGRSFELNAPAMFKITLFDQPSEPIVLGVKTAWTTPQRNEHRLPSGVGFAFDTTDVAMSLHQRVSKLLANVAQPSMTV